MRKSEIPEAAIQRVRRMRAVLLEDQPFYGFLALKLKLQEDPTCDTMWTDGESLGFSPKFVAETPDLQLKGTICHEVLHVAGGHPWRQEHREHEQWNEACDYAVNPMVDEAGYLLPEGVLRDKRFFGMSAEAIYRILEDEKQQKQKQQKQNSQQSSSKDADPSEQGNSGQDESSAASEDKPESGQGSQTNGQSQSKPGASKASRAGEVRRAPAHTREPGSEYSQEAWSLAINNAVIAQGTLSQGLQRLVAANQRNVVNWEEVLRDFAERSASKTEYTWRRPSVRYASMGISMPVLEGKQLPAFVFAVDSSGSVPDQDIALAQAGMQALLDECNPEVLYVLYCDAAVVAYDAFYPGDLIDLRPKGGGGTDFRPVFEWAKVHAPDAAGVIYITDLAGTFPEASSVELPTLWLATSSARNKSFEKVPFGTVAQLPVS